MKPSPWSEREAKPEWCVRREEKAPTWRVRYTGGRMPQVVYRSDVRIERMKGPLRRAWLPAESEPVWFGAHGAVAEHYGIPPEVLEPHATTLDYIVAATAG